MWRGVGIVGTGFYIPDFRIAVSSLADAWGQAQGQVGEKSVPNDDEDAVTMGIEAARAAIIDAGIEPSDLSAVWLGTESKPYAAKAASATVAEAIGATPWVGAADLEFACRGAIEGLLALAARVEAGRCGHALIVGVDTAQGRPGDQLEHTAGAGAAAFIVGPAERARVVLSDSVSYVTDTADFFRRDGAVFPTHAHRFTGQPAYFEHVGSAARMFLEQTATLASDYRFIVLHQPNLKFPREVAKSLGFSDDQIEPVLLFERIGNTYAASAMLSLARAFDLLEPEEKVLVTCYGSGAGADCFAVMATSAVCQRSVRKLDDYLKRTKMLRHYGEYLTLTRQVGGER